MADRIIQTETLTAIGNAIRSKTGGSALINPEDMAEEISEIVSGRTLLVDYTTPEDVSAIRIDFTSEMLDYDIYELEFRGSETTFPYIGLNSETSTTYMNTTGWSENEPNYVAFARKDGNRFALIMGRTSVVDNLSYIHYRVYRDTETLQAGYNVKIWGYKNQ